MPSAKRGALKLTVVILAAAAIAAAALYLNARSARLASDALTSALGQPVTVRAAAAAPSTGVLLYGVSVKGPFKDGPELLTVKLVRVIPDMKELLHGRIVISSVDLVSPHLTLEQKGGAWNFQPMLDRFRKQKGPGRKFTLSSLRVRGGRVELPEKGVSVSELEAEVSHISNMVPGPARFSLSMKESRGASLTAKGAADIFAGEKTVDAALGISVASVERYTGKRPGMDLARVRLTADASLHYRDNALTIEKAVVRVPGVTSMSAEGSVKELTGAGAADITVRAAPLDLAALKKYLPAGARLAGRVMTDDIRIRGRLRPAGLDLLASARVEGVEAVYGDRGLKDINGAVNAALAPDGAVRASFGLAAGGGRLKGRAAYKNGGTFSLEADGITLTNGPSVAGLAVSGSFNKLLKTVTGDIRAASVSIRDKKVTGLRASYAYSGGTLRLADLGFGFRGASVHADGLTAGPKGDTVAVNITGGSAKYGEYSVAGLWAGLTADARKKAASGRFGSAGVSVTGMPCTVDANFSYGPDGIKLTATGGMDGNPFTAEAGASWAETLKNPRLSANLKINKIGSLNTLLKKHKVPVTLSAGKAELSVSASGPALDRLAGAAVIDMEGLSLDKGGKTVAEGITATLRPSYEDGAVTLPATKIAAAGLVMKISGGGRKEKEGFSAEGDLVLPETEVEKLQEAALGYLPPALKWADVGGTAWARAHISYVGGNASVSGSLSLKDAWLDMPEKKLHFGPMTGPVPVAYAQGGKAAPRAAKPLESFTKGDYPALLKKYSNAPPEGDRFVIKKASFGLIEADEISVKLAEDAGVYRLSGLAFSGFGGRGYGYGTFDPAGGGYSLSLLVNDVSIAGICDTFPALKGYLSGRVDGLMRVRADGPGLEAVQGAGYFWTKDYKGEKRMISKALLKRMMGRSLKNYMLIGDRAYDTGEMDVIVSGGDLVFDKLLISNTTFFGYRDLSISVAPVSNRIAIGHLLEVIRDVSGRAGQGAAPTQ